MQREAHDLDALSVQPRSAQQHDTGVVAALKVGRMKLLAIALVVVCLVLLGKLSHCAIEQRQCHGQVVVR